MKIDCLKDLQKIIKLCRQTGVESVRIGDVELHLGPTPIIYKATKRIVPVTTDQLKETQAYIPGGVTPEMQIPTDGLTPDQLLFYSSDGQSASNEQ